MFSITNFACEDPLWPVYVFPDSVRYCYICGCKIHGDAYSSKKKTVEEGPEFIIHEECAKLPEEVTHRFHPHHLLVLQKHPSASQFNCHVCNRWVRYAYCCSDCEYHFDVKCASLNPEKDQQNCFDDPDFLIRCRGPDHYQYSCYVCWEVIEDVVFVDPKSRRLLHESCANLPEEINHPFHPSHPLTLVCQGANTNGLQLFTCNACGTESRGHYFCCSECKFYLDVRCAFLVPADKKHESMHNLHFHQHPLVQCDPSRSVAIYCSACKKLCRSSVYACIECHIVLDESCIKLPEQLQHPLHLQHPLILYKTYKTAFQCNVCFMYSRGLMFACLTCCFTIPTACALPIPPTLKSEIHQHPLVFFEKPNKSFPCHNCGQDCTTPFLCCLQCAYYLHLYCLPESPRVVKHQRHLHPLSFTDSLVKDHPDEDEEAELYCNACEERRKLVDPTYYCADCHFVAHTHCATSEILAHLDISSKKAIMEEGEDTKGPIGDGLIISAELKSEIATLDKEITEIKQQVEKLKTLKKQCEEKVNYVKFIASIFGQEYSFNTTI